MQKYFLAIDIGASSGRHVLGYRANGRLHLEEIYRFENHCVTTPSGTLTWDLSHLCAEVVNGLKACAKQNKIPSSIGIDTWGVDYVLIDAQGKAILPLRAYRDAGNTIGVSFAEAKMSFADLYARTGIQKMVFNTVYQLCRDHQERKLDGAATFLMVPEYLNYYLTGEKLHEYTNCSTTALLNLASKTWDEEVIDKLGLPRHLFTTPLAVPGTTVGSLTPAMRAAVGFDTTVILVGSHDTASAVLGAPLDDDSIYLSSGTWSLIGAETTQPICDQNSLRHNYTNEGGYQYRNRFLKNIIGLWVVQNLREELSAQAGKKLSFSDVMALGEEGQLLGTFDVNDSKFLVPGNMIGKIKESLRITSEVPVADLVRSLYESLAQSYAVAVQNIEQLTNKHYATLLIVGGGSKDKLLNQLTKKYVPQKRVFYGPTETTAIGNILAQLAASEHINDVHHLRQIVKNSFEIKEVV